jgi:microsomal dipeptidase-like Zn-dependent dipeptidase
VTRRRTFASLLAAGLIAVALAMPIEAAPVQGYVDLHSHLAGEYAFGGGWFWGTVEGPMDWAVRRCDGNFPTPSHAASAFPIVSEFLGADTGWHLGRRRGYDRRRCRYFLGFIPVPGTCPRPHFEHWPKWDAIAHQQMWNGWLEQAHQRGLRVMVVSLVESNFLCTNTRAVTRRFDCDEMASVRRQAAYIRDFASRNSARVGIATSPQQARALIAQGKLALVLSVEVTRLFPHGDFIAQLDDLRAMGVSSVQIAHHADNRFAGAAPIPKLMNAANQSELLWSILLGFPVDMTDIDEIECRDGAGNTGSCNGDTRLNVQGLTPDGDVLVRAMMDRGMLVDVAHLSRHAFRDVYAIAHQRGDYPLLYSHAHMWDTISPDEERHEKYIRADEIAMITGTGGMIGLRTGPESTVSYGPVENRCQGSTRSFAQSLTYAVDHGLNVGFGADFNGFIEQLKPRYNLLGCRTDFREIVAAGGPTELQKKGLAHVGLLPELMTDLRSVGVPVSYVDHLNRSAESFLLMWERSVGLGTGVGTNLARQATAAASSTYCSGSGEHCYSAGRVNDGDASTVLGGFHSWANANGAAMPQWVELRWGVPVTASRVELFTTAGYELRSYEIQYLSGGSWLPLVTVTDNTLAHRSHSFAPSSMTGLRVLGREGPNDQPGYVRVNEIEVY